MKTTKQKNKEINAQTNIIKQKIKNALRNYNFIFLAAIIPAFIFFLIYAVRGLYPFGNSTVLVLDLNGQYVYFFEALKDAVLEGGSLLYSWSRSLGGEFLGIYAYYLASPLSYLILLFPDGNTQEFLLVMFLIKAAICGATMSFFLYHSSKTKNKTIAVIFSTLYAVSAYCVVHQSNTMWMDAVMWLPLLIYGIEELIKTGKYKTFTISLALTVGSNFYIGYMCCIFVFLYFFFYYLAHSKDNENNPLKERFHFLKSFIRVGIFSVIAICITAVIILSAYYSLSFGKTDFSETTWDFSFRFDIFDLLFKGLTASYDTVRIDGLPFIYCGILTVICAPLYFCSKKINAREKIYSGAMILLLIASMTIPAIDIIWHGFQNPQWLNARYSFMLCFFLVSLAFKAFEDIENINLKNLFITSTAVVLYIIVLQYLDDDFVEKLEALKYGPDDGEFIVHPFATIGLSLLLVATYTAFIALWKNNKKKTLSVVLLCIVSVEVFISGLCNVNDFDEDVGFTTHSKYTSFGNLITPITETLLDYDTSFYRFEKTYHRKTNDNMAYQIRGLSNSTSTLNESTIKFLKLLGYRSLSHNSIYSGGTPATDSLLGLKYIISDKDYSDLYGEPILTGKDYAQHMGISLEELEKLTTTTDFKNFNSADFSVYYNPYHLSLAFSSSDDILDVVMKEYNIEKGEEHETYCDNGFKTPFDRINAIITAILGEEKTVEVFKPATLIDISYPSGVTVKSSNLDTYTVYVGSGKTITFSYSAPENVHLFAAIPAYYSRSVEISSDTMPIFDSYRSDGKLVPTDGTCYLKNGSQRIINLGNSSSEEYSLKIKTNSNDLYVMKDISLVYYIDMNTLEDAFTRIQEGQIKLNDEYSETSISGEIVTKKENQLVLTSIPYDEGWRVYVDGKRVETKEALNALVSFYINDAGEHSIKFLYLPTPFITGLSISIIALAGFILIIVFENKIKKFLFPLQTTVGFQDKQQK